MADRGDTHFHVPTLNKWFLLSSVFLLGTVVWTVIDDWAAEWKVYQREFRIPEPSRDAELLFRVLHAHLEDFSAQRLKR